MFCENCGSKINAGDKFCNLCGSTVESYTYTQQAQKAQSTQPAQSAQKAQPTQITQQAQPTQPAQQTIPVQPVQPTQPIQPAQPVQTKQQSQQSSQLPLPQQNKTFENQKTNNKPNKHSKKIAIIITSIVLSVVLVLAGTVWYFAKNISLTSIGLNSNPGVIPKAKVGDNADNIAKTLENNGFRTKVIDEFSSKKQGSFLRYVNIKPGSHKSTSTVVKILRSKGPGVPAKGVVGASLDEAKKIVKSMGVPVRLHHVPSTDAAAGKIVASNPMPGNAVGKDGVIHVAIGEKRDGVPVDLFGLDKDKAKDMLSSKPFVVNLRPKFSSPKYFGKIVGAYPALGTKGKPKAVTLYYGVDASKTRDVVTEPMHLEDKTAYLVTRAGSFIGKWCTKSGKCINLIPRLYKNEKKWESDEKSIAELIPADIADKNGRIPDEDNKGYINTKGVLELNSGGQDPTDRAIFDKNIPDSEFMRNHLISGDTGAVELYSGGGVIECGGEDTFIWGAGFTCVNGKYVQFPDNNPEEYDRIHNEPGYDLGYYYTMRDFMVIVPVGAKFDKLVNSGYFVGKPTHKPDLKRPFILRRDPKLYKETRRNQKPGSDWVNPFVPTERSRAVPFAPAPDDSNAYYLVEEPFDWDDYPSESL
ncbi:PASTA domain-containing protein [Gardnerella vaginalis]|uniref:PASTA domain-containing protein n=1 Tax=Gardnerella vaginalis TaxID=2702 RepID=UPI0039EE3FFE